MIDAGVQETLFFPLLGRARAARSWPSCFRDSWSERLVSMVAAVHPGIENMDMGEMPAAIYALRHLAAVTEIRRYLETRPGAAVVDLGCGLDRLVDEVDNGRALIYNLDFPGVLEARRAWAEPHERERELPFSLTDHRWMDEVDPSGGLIAVASGVFYFGEQVSSRPRQCDGLPLSRRPSDLRRRVPGDGRNERAGRTGSRNRCGPHALPGRRPLRCTRLELSRIPDQGELRPVLLRR